MNIAHRCRGLRALLALELIFALASPTFQLVSVHAKNFPVNTTTGPGNVGVYSLPNEDATGSTSSSAKSPVEWVYHKTRDGSHPDGQEQQIVWLMNRARANPQAEADWLISTSAPDVALARDFFKIDNNLLVNEMVSYQPKPPAAFDVRLYNAALAHDRNLVQRDSQDHDGQYDRVVEAGFACDGGNGYFFRGNVFSFAEDGLNTHAAWNIDWGGPQGGMQLDRGHRMGVMSADGDLTNVGIAMLFEGAKETLVGPYVTTANYCHAAEIPGQYNRFLTGTVWQDKNANQMYDPDEGIGGVKVAPRGAHFYAVTGESGGYAVPITQPGNYHVIFSGKVSGFHDVSIGDTSALLDYIYRPQIGAAIP